MKHRPIGIGVGVVVFLLVAATAVDEWTFRSVSSGLPAGVAPRDGPEGRGGDAGPDGEAGSTPPSKAGPYSLEGNRVAVPEGGARQVVDALRARAESGDGAAALTIYLKLRECREVLSNSPSEDELARYREVGAAAQLSRSELSTLEDCEDAVAMLDDHAKWLEMAAEAGVEEAQLLFAMDPSPFLGGVEGAIRNPHAVQQYKHKAMRYLDGLASKGNIEGVQALANAYDAGVLAPADIQRAYAYYRTAELMSPGLYGPEFMELQRSRVPADRRAGAEELAKKLYSRCCRR